MINKDKWNVNSELFGFSYGNSKDFNYTSLPCMRAPRGIAVDERTGIMYVCDMFDKIILVFNLEGEHITSFGNNLLEKPWGILLYGDVLFVTDVGRQTVFKFRDFVTEVPRTRIKFRFPRGMSIVNKTSELFITDEENHRVVLCSTDPLQYSGVFAENIPSPYDVTICNETHEVYVLNTRTPYIFKYSLSGELLAKLIDLKEKSGPWFFCYSSYFELFILSDYKNSNVRIFDLEETLVGQIDEFRNPVFGMALTSDLKLIVGSYDETHKIKIFQLTKQCN